MRIPRFPVRRLFFTAFTTLVLFAIACFAESPATSSPAVVTAGCSLLHPAPGLAEFAHPALRLQAIANPR